MNCPKIYIGGNIYGAGNIGDDAVLQGILRILESAMPEVTVTVGTYQGQRLEYLPPSLQYVSSYDIPEVTAVIRRSDCFISGGGTMIGDELGLSFPLGYNAKLMSLAKLYGKRVAMLAIGANQLRSDAGVKTGMTMVRLCDLITVRDEGSRSVCLKLGAEHNRTVTTADPAFLLAAKETPRTKELKERLRARGRVFGINVVNEAWAHLDQYKMSIARTCEYLHSRHGYLPVFFCNEIRPGNFFDFDANRRTATLLRCEHEVLAPVYYSPEEMIDIISTFEFVIGMRMHSLIFSAVANVLFVSISRVDKVDNFMRLFGLKNSGSVDSCDSKQIIANVESLLEVRETVQNHIAKRVDILRQECLKNVDLFRSLLSKSKLLWHKVNASSLMFVLSKNRCYNTFWHLMRGEKTIAQIVRKLKNTFG
jgi:polysaccharide pyruvyl transferase WcaK-like protein